MPRHRSLRPDCPSSEDAAREKIRAIGGWTAVAVAATLLFAVVTWPALGCGFVADDFMLVERGTAATAGGVLRPFVTEWGWGYYRPIVDIAVALDRSQYGLWAPGYRLTNVALHLVSTALVLMIGIRRVGLSPEASSGAAVLFLLHPFHDQSVLWISGRTDLLCAVFYLTAFHLVLRGDGRRLLIGLMAFVLALASKEMAATLPLVVFAFRICFAEGTVRQRLRVALRGTAPLLGVLALFLLWRASVVDGLGGDPAFRDWTAAALKSTAKLLQWLFVPWDFAILKAVLREHPPLLYAAGAVSLACFIAIVRPLARSRAALFAAWWVALTLLPVHARPHAWYLYIPSVGAVLLMAALLQATIRAPTARRIAVALVALVFGFALHLNAWSFRSAASIADDAVAFFAGRSGPVFLVNAPLVYRGRIPILTSGEQYAIALSLLGEPTDVRVLNYVYVGSPADPRTRVSIARKRLDLALETGPDTYFTLDAVSPSPPSAPSRGFTLRGDHGTYTVTDVDTQGKIRGLTIADLPVDFTAGMACLTEFREGRFRMVAGCPP